MLKRVLFLFFLTNLRDFLVGKLLLFKVTRVLFKIFLSENKLN